MRMRTELASHTHRQVDVSGYAPKIDKRRDKGEGADLEHRYYTLCLELGTKTVSKELMATMDTPTVECSSDTSKTDHSTRTGEDGSSGTGKTCTGHSLSPTPPPPPPPQ